MHASIRFRGGGRFFWRQVEQALASGATTLYGAMFDEVDEGTAMFKIASTARDAPAGVATVTLDADGEPLPSDWYLRLAREAQKRLSAARSARGADPRSPPQREAEWECKKHPARCLAAALLSADIRTP